MRSLKKLLRVDPGFQPSGVLTMQVTNTGSAYRGDSVHARYFNAVIDAVRQVPGVAAAAAASQVPLTGDMDGYAYETPLRPHVLGDASAFRYAVTPEYFHTMGMTLLRGRLLEATDVAGAPEVVVVSESFARRVFGSADPIGQRVRFGPEVDSKRPWDIVVGVVNDVRQQSLDLSDAGAFYVPMGQWWWVDNVQSIVVRTSGNAAALAPAIRRAIWSVDANQPVQNVATMDALVASSAAQRRFALVIIESFAGAALVLAAVGLYGVIAGGVTERTREIGIRTALGATPRAVLRQVMRGGLALAAGGIVLGGLAAIVANRVLTSLLFEISPTDPLTYAGVILALLAVAVAASWFPARRAARIDPAITLRAD